MTKSGRWEVASRRGRGAAVVRFVLSGLALLPAFLLAGMATGCASAVQAGTTTSLTGDDLVRMTDAMAPSIAGDPEVRAAIAAGGPLRVVVRPAENDLRGDVLPPGQALAFTGRVRVLLGRYAPDDFTWVMNRDDYYELRARELDPTSGNPASGNPASGNPASGIDPGPSPDAVDPQYALTATFKSLASEDLLRQSRYYLCAFRLTDLADRTVLWTGSYEVKKAAKKKFLD